MSNRHPDSPVRLQAPLQVLFLACLAWTVSCGGGGGGTDSELVGAVTISESDLDLPVRAAAQLVVVVKDPDGNTLHNVPVTYSTSAPQVAEVDPQGFVTAVAEGSATITAMAEGKGASIPVTVSVLDFVSIAAGGSHTCGLLDSGAVWCWGKNDVHQLGLGGGDQHGAFPHRLDGELSFQSLSGGSNLTCGLAGTGRAYCWGEVRWGVLTEMVTEIWEAPQQVPGDLTFESFGTSGTHMCGLTADGKAYCWGQNHFSECGTNQAVTGNAFLEVDGDLQFDVLAPNSRHTCGIDSDGVTHCWGDNEFGELGHGGGFFGVVEGGHLFRSLAPGGILASCGITAAGDAYCWGRNHLGQLGGGPSDDRTTPTLVPGGLQLSSLSLAFSHGCGVTEAELAYCWGDNAMGQLGDGTRAAKASPSLVSGGHNFVQVTTGDFHTCGLTASGSVYCWGDNSSGQLGAGSAPPSSDTPVLVHGSR